MRSTVLRSTGLVAAAAATLVLAACGSGTEPAASGTASGSASGDASAGSGQVLRVAGVPSEESTSLEAQFESLGALIEGETGMTTEFQTATDYAAVIEGLRAGQIDVAMMGPFSYMIAKDSGVDLVPAAAITDTAEEDPGYYSIGWVAADSDITDINGFADKTVCFVDVASTSGYLYPSAGLLEAGIDPKTGVEPIMAGGHDASLLSIANGTCDAGFAYEEMQQQLVDSGQLDEGAVKEVWRSEKIMGSPIAVNAGSLDQAAVDELVDVLGTKANKPYMVEKGYCTSEDDCPLPEDTDYGFKPVTDADYDGVRAVCDITEADACKA